MDLIQQTIADIKNLDAQAMAAARRRQATLTKPPGSLGRLEALAVQVAGITGSGAAPVRATGGDGAGRRPWGNGTGRERLSSRSDGADGTRNAAGGAAINVVAQRAGARVVIATWGWLRICGRAGSASLSDCLGTHDMTQGPAMSAAQARSAMEAGIAIVAQEAAMGMDVVCTGEMGIGNTTAAAAITSVIMGAAPEEVTGRGTGLDDQGLAHKTAVVRRALAVNQPDPTDGLDVLARVGGFDIGGLTGVILAAAARRIPVVLDGYIAGAAALLAVTLCPPLAPFWWRAIARQNLDMRVCWPSWTWHRCWIWGYGWAKARAPCSRSRCSTRHWPRMPAWQRSRMRLSMVLRLPPTRRRATNLYQSRTTASRSYTCRNWFLCSGWSYSSGREWQSAYRGLMRIGMPATISVTSSAASASHMLTRPSRSR